MENRAHGYRCQPDYAALAALEPAGLVMRIMDAIGALASSAVY
jgi:hypothetical protein